MSNTCVCFSAACFPSFFDSNFSCLLKIVGNGDYAFHRAFDGLANMRLNCDDIPASFPHADVDGGMGMAILEFASTFELIILSEHI